MGATLIVPLKIGGLSVHRPIDVTAYGIDCARPPTGEMERQLLRQMQYRTACIDAIGAGGIGVDDAVGSRSSLTVTVVAAGVSVFR